MKGIFGKAAAIALICTAGVSQAQDRSLRIATSVPQDHYLTRSITEFANRVTEKTDGKVTFEVYPAQSLVTDQQMDQAVASGVVDIGVGSASIMAGTVPALNIFAVPFYFDTREKLDNSVTIGTPIRDTLDAEIRKTGLNAAFWIPFGSVTLVMRDKPVRLPQEMVGLKIRSFGATVSKFIESVGAAPVVTSGGEQFLALQRGIVDGGLTGWTSVTGRRLYDVADYVVATDHMYETHFALMSQTMWDSLSPEVQEIFVATGKELEQELLGDIFEVSAEAKAELTGKMEVIELTADEKLAWKDATKSVAEDFLANSGPIATEIFKEAQKIQ
ncbi:TRAP transporter substrate-binding protein DctP [Roseovarius aestuarii]|nr:TRAP transporter substrate-binding protein DctP [Roseovarius aestuarii]